VGYLKENRGKKQMDRPKWEIGIGSGGVEEEDVNRTQVLEKVALPKPAVETKEMGYGKTTERGNRHAEQNSLDLKRGGKDHLG